MTSWIDRSALEQRDALLRREVSATELLEATLERATRIAGTVNPIALRLDQHAMEAADKADRVLRKGRPGPLCGLPVSIKDSQWLKGVRCANGSQSLVNFVPDATCRSVDRLEQAGAVIFGKTTCPEFCLSGTNNSPLYGATRNPWDLSKTPGGSSGGAAASIAAGVGSLSLGGDGGGSIRIPAAFCGVVGFKPTHGVVPRGPGFGTWDALIAYGPMARSVADARLMFDAVATHDKLMPAPRKGKDAPLRIVVSEDLGFAPVDASIRECFRQVTLQLADAGITCIETNPGLTSSVVTWASLATHDMWLHKRDQEFNHPDLRHIVGRYAREFIHFGSRFTDQDIADAHSHQREIFNAYSAMFDRSHSNILITPTLGCEAFDGSLTHPAWIEQKEITYPWLDWAGLLYDANLTGMPSCSIPMGFGESGLPVGLQIMGRPGHDLEVLDAAEAIEKIIGWQHQIAPDFVLRGDGGQTDSVQVGYLPDLESVSPPGELSEPQFPAN
jgi:Asp-tRNA(Asn)/Glu-tRNA(Gln) amidotransferase A subunit family amidase